MIKIFDIENQKVIPSIDILLIEPFKTIWERDKNEFKINAYKDFAFIEFMVSPYKSNPYKDINEEKRVEIIKKEVLKDIKYEPDELVLNAIDLYKEWLYNYSLSYRFLESAKKAANEVIKFLNNVSLEEKNNIGNPIYKPADITKALKDLNEAIKNIQEIEKRVFDELSKPVVRGNKEINPLET